MALEFWLTNTPIGGGGGAVGTPVSIQLANGNVLVAWSGNGQNGLRYALFDLLANMQGSGNLSPTAAVPQYVYDLIPTADGGFDLLYRQDANGISDLWLQHFSATLTGTIPQRLAQDIATLTNLPADAAALPLGGLAVVYTSKTTGLTFDFGNISLRLLAADGTAGPTILVNTTTAGRQLDARVASNGQNLFVTWWDEATGDVRGQMLSLSGVKIGGEFLVPSTASGSAGRPEISSFPNGNYVVAWEADGADGADNQQLSARARLFDPSGNPLGPEFVLNQQIQGLQGAPDITVMPDGTFFASWFDSSAGYSTGSFRRFDGNGVPLSDTISAAGFPGSQTALVTIDDGRIAAFGIDANLSWLIIDAREGNYDGTEGDNVLVSRRTGPTTINGFAGNDRFFGNDDGDTFYGGSGNDEFRSKLGLDTLYGGPGDDTYYLTPFSNTPQNRTEVFENANEGNDTIWTTFLSSLPANVENAFLYEDAGTSSVTGNLSHNWLRGNAFDNILSGLAGNDLLDGLGGNDTLVGGTGEDALWGGEGTDTVSYAGDLGAVFVNLTLGQGYGNAAQGDTYTSIEHVIGTGYNDFIIGDTGVNRLDGGTGNDILIGAIGADQLIGGSGTDMASYEDNSGTVFVNLTLNAGSNNAAQGDSYDGIENLIGGLFDDFFIGDEQANRLDGALGADTLLGAGGADTFVFKHAPGAASGFTHPNSAANIDTILDFQSGVDTIELSQSAFSALGLGRVNASAFVIGTAAQDADDRIIYDSATGRLYYDADGSGSGEAVLFAVLDNKAPIAATDFAIAP